MDGGAWWAAVHGVAESWTWRSNWAHTWMSHDLFFLLFMSIWIVSRFYKCWPECSYLLFGADVYAFLLGVFKGIALPGDGECSARGGGADCGHAPPRVSLWGFCPLRSLVLVVAVGGWQGGGRNLLLPVRSRTAPTQAGRARAALWAFLGHLCTFSDEIIVFCPFFQLDCLFCFLLLLGVLFIHSEYMHVWQGVFFLLSWVCLPLLSQWCPLKNKMSYFNVSQVISLFSNT